MSEKPVRPDSGNDAAPTQSELLSFNERRQWFLERLTPDGAANMISAATRLVGDLDVPALKTAIQAVVDRHELLRTRYSETDGEPHRRVETECPVELCETALPAGTGVDLKAEIRRQAALEESVAFDLEKGPLFRFILYRRSPSEHILLRVFNHIITDSWSDQVLMRDLGDCYSAAVKGNDPVWPEPVVRYGEFVARQREQLTPKVVDEQLNYWRDQLIGAPPALEMVTDLRRPTLAGEEAGEVLGLFREDVVADAKKLAQEEGATSFAVVAGAFARFLGIYTGQDDLVIGFPAAGRKGARFRDVVGFFVNSLALRVRLHGDPTFRELVRQVKETSRGALQHQEIPFDRVVQELRPERDLGRTPIFQAIMAFQNYPRTEPRFEGLKLEHLFELGHRAAVPCDVALRVYPDGRDWDCQLLYRRDLFEAATAVRLMRHLTTLLERVVREPDTPLSRISVADAEEVELAVEKWSGITTEYPGDSCVHTLFEEQAEARPESVAVVMGGDRMTYRELNERANRLAHRLRDLGVGPETVVGLFGARAIDSIVAILAVFKAGGAYLPMDPEAPASRIAYLVANGGVPVVLAHGAEQVDLVPDSVATVDLTDPGAFTHNGTGNPGTEVAAHNLAYVLYTSGSTGDPKGVEVEHRQIIREVRGCDYFDYPPDRVFSNLAPLWFDVSCIEIWGALLNGATCVIYPERLPTADGLRGFFTKHGVTTVHMIASLLNVMLDEFPESLRGLKELFTGGEALDPVHIDNALRMLPHTRVFNVYGPTECATIATYFEIPRENWARRRAVPIGRPVANTTTFILDEHGAICPPGVPGELHIGGDGVARGYLGDPELTSRRFVPDPFSDRPGARLYRTGDRCRYLEDGLVDFLGRTDDQVKVRGFRIEPGEISAVLNQCEGVRISAVVAKERPSGGRYLVAYVVADADPVPPVDTLRRHMAERLPAYMMPETFVMLEELPLTASGKIDVRSLPDPPEIIRDSSRVTQPRNATELQLVAIWARVLGITDVGIDDDFFALGGNSLLALRLFSEIEITLGESLPLATLFQAPTVRSLMELWGRGSHREGWSCVVPIQPKGEKTPFYCVHGLNGNVIAQRSLAQRMGSDQPYYAIQAVGLDGRTPPLRSVEAMATRYLADIRKVQSQGPYLIGGYCFGGLVAFEMARVLVAAGEDVPLLVMIDPPVPLSEEESRDLRPRPSAKAVLGYLARRFRILRDHRWWIEQTHIRARDRYVPGYFGGRVLLLTSTHHWPQNVYTVERAERWGELVQGEYDCHIMEGFHGLIFSEPMVGFMAEKINASLEDASGSDS